MKSKEGPPLFHRHRTPRHGHNSLWSWLLSSGFPLEVKLAAQSGLPWPCVGGGLGYQCFSRRYGEGKAETLASTHGCVKMKEWRNYTILFLKEDLSVVWRLIATICTEIYACSSSLFIWKSPYPYIYGVYIYGVHIYMVYTYMVYIYEHMRFFLFMWGGEQRQVLRCSG